jgi:hypothetical protein
VSRLVNVGLSKPSLISESSHAVTSQLQGHRDGEGKEVEGLGGG